MSEFTDYLPEVFAEFGAVTTRKMFGGYGVYHRGFMFALVADDTLYLKVDAHSRDEFTARDLPPFVYTGGKKPIAMSYHLAPEEIYDDAAAAAKWAQLAYAAATRAKKVSANKKTKKKMKKKK